MSLLRRVERRTANLNALTQILESVGRSPRSTAGQRVDADSAKRVMAVWRCQHLLADIVAGLPIDQYRKQDKQRVEVTPSEFVRSPSNQVDGHEWRYQIMLSALDTGNAFAYITEFDGSYRFARKAEVLAPADVTVRQAGALAPARYWVGSQEVDAARIMHLRAFGPMPGTTLGMSPIQYAATTIGTALASKSYGAGWYEGGGHPTTALVSDQVIDAGDAATAKQRFKDATLDDHVVALGKGWKVQPLQVNPKDALFLDSINASAVEVCGFFGIPPEMLGYASEGGGSLTYANREQRALDLLVFTVQWWIGRMERLISGQTPSPQFVKINVDALLRSDLLTRYKAHDMRIRGGWGTPNEARALEDLPPLPDGYGDDPLWPPYASGFIAADSEDSTQEGSS
jgi:HK97 family phage portal protein